MILVVWSEKMYWYLPGYTFVELVIFYSFPTMMLLWAIGRFRVSNTAALALTADLFTLAVEGIITPVVYEDGPLPIVGLYLYAWHGGLSVMFGWYIIRKWALAHRRVALGVASLGMGAVWGLWSTTY